MGEVIIVVIEYLESAQARGANIYAEIVGYRTTGNMLSYYSASSRR